MTMDYAGAPGSGGSSFGELYNPPKGWHVEMAQDGVYWRQDVDRYDEAGRPVPNVAAGLLYNPRTEMVESAPGSSEWVSMPLKKGPTSSESLSREKFDYQQQTNAERERTRAEAQASRDALARERLALDKDKADLLDGIKREELEFRRQESEARRKVEEAATKAAEARDQRNFDAAERWKGVGQSWTEKVDALNRAWDDKQFSYKQQQADLDRQDKDLDRQIRIGEAVGQVDGQTTLAGRAQALREKQYEDELANAPKNFFNYAFRMRGYEPPALAGQPAPVAQVPGAPATPAAPTSAPAEAPPVVPPGFSRPSGPGPNRADIGRDAGPGGLDIPGLKAKYSATELARLDLGSLAQFSNEDLLEIGKQYPGGVQAFLNLFPRERIIGSGQYGGSGFGSEYQAAYDQAHPENVLPGAPSQEAGPEPTRSLQPVGAGGEPWESARLAGAPAPPQSGGAVNPNDFGELSPAQQAAVEAAQKTPVQAGTIFQNAGLEYQDNGLVVPRGTGSMNPSAFGMVWKNGQWDYGSDFSQGKRISNTSLLGQPGAPTTPGAVQPDQEEEPRPSIEPWFGHPGGYSGWMKDVLKKQGKNPALADIREGPANKAPLRSLQPHQLVSALPGAPSAVPAWAGSSGGIPNLEDDWYRQNEEG